MAELIEKIDNLMDVIDKNKEKFSMKDCHNFVAYFSSIKEGIKGLDDKIKADNNRHVVIQEVIAKSHNASIEKIGEIKESVELLNSNTTNIEQKSDTLKSDFEEVKSKCINMEEKFISLEEKLNENKQAIDKLQEMVAKSHNGLNGSINKSHNILFNNNMLVINGMKAMLQNLIKQQGLEPIQETSDEEKGSSDSEVVNDLAEEVIEINNDEQEVSDNEEEESGEDEETDESEDEEEESHPNVTLEVSDK